MIIIDNLLQVANQIETERGVDKEILFSAIEQALVSAYTRRISYEINVTCSLSPESGEAFLYQIKEVVKSVENNHLEILKKEATLIDPKVKVGDTVKIEIKTTNFGRIAAQTAKQVIAQRLREAEKDSIYEEFQNKVGKIITGTVQQVDQFYCLVNLGRTESVLTRREQIHNETFQPKDKIKVYIVSIEKESKGNQIIISRTHPNLIKCLFQQEIPEIHDGIIEIKAVSREAGKRAKVAVKTNNPAISAVGTCVGQMGGRIQTIIKELGTEKIDVLEWDENPIKFIANSLKPAQITKVIIEDKEQRIATVIVPQDQLSLAIGKAGVNVRLSANLTEWKLNIKTESDYGAPLEDNFISNETMSNSLSLVEKLKREKINLQDDNEENNKEIQSVNISDENNDNNETPDESNKNHIIEDETTNFIEAVDLAEMLNLSIDSLIKQAKKHGVIIKSEKDKISIEQINILKEKMAS